MSSYIRSILITAMAAHMILLSAGELGGEQTKKILRFLCGLVVLLTLFAPLNSFINGITDALETVFAEAEMQTSPAETVNTDIAAAESAYAYIAEEWIRYLTEQYGLEAGQIRLILTADDNNALTEVQLILRQCPYVLREKIREDMQEKMEIPVHVSGE